LPHLDNVRRALAVADRKTQRGDGFAMPTYEYRCDACGHQFDELQSFSDPVLKKCPQCKKPKLQRLFGTGAAILFKGSGFYETDYRRGESYKKAAEADKEPAPTSKDGAAATNGTTDAAGSSNGASEAKGAAKKGGTKSPKSKT
jgi:putative FmdB family regulatory protein